MWAGELRRLLVQSEDPIPHLRVLRVEPAFDLQTIPEMEQVHHASLELKVATPNTGPKRDRRRLERLRRPLDE